MSSRIGPGQVVPRRAEMLVLEAAADTRVVLLNGARQTGKSTLLRLVGDSLGAQWRTFDDVDTLAASRLDPRGFVDEVGPLVIDEIQRNPDLLLAIKARVDAVPVPGSFLLSGSARLLGMRAAPDSLVGRMETIELWPFSQGEIDGTHDGFVDAAFEHGAGLRVASGPARRDYALRVARGGFPEAVARTDPRRRDRFFSSYVNDLVVRDVLDVGRIERGDEMMRMIRLLAAGSGQLLVVDRLANACKLSNATARRYLAMLSEVFLIKRIPAWSRNLSSRATATEKVAMVDAGVAASLVSLSADAMLRPTTSAYGSLLEGFVLMELARQLTWSRTRAELYHYRTRDGVEVDAVLEDRQGRVVAIEVKAAATVRAEDFRGLRHLAERLGDDFVVGVVLHTGPDTLSFGPNLLAMPVSALWTAPSPSVPG